MIAKDTRMDLSQIREELIDCNDDKRIDIVLRLVSLEKKYSNPTTKTFIRLYISFVVCHFESKSKYSGIKSFCQTVIKNLDSFTSIELKDIILNSQYLYVMFQEDPTFREQLDQLFPIIFQSTNWQAKGGDSAGVKGTGPVTQSEQRNTDNLFHINWNKRDAGTRDVGTGSVSHIQKTS